MRPAGPCKVIGPWSEPRPGRSPRAPCDSAQLALQHVHQQAVMPRTVGPALVAAHDPDRAEADALVAADRGGVVSRRVDRVPVVTALLEQPPRDGADGVRAEAPAVVRRVQREVDSAVAVHRVGLLPALRQADDLVADADRPRGRVGLALDDALAHRLVILARPPPRHLGRREDRRERRDVRLGRRAKDDPLAAQDGHGPSHRPTGSAAPAAASSSTPVPTSARVATSTSAIRAIVLTFERCIADGAPGHGVSTTARTSSPAARAASTVKSVCEIVPRPGRAATTTGRPRAAAGSRTVKSTVSGTSRPPPPSTTSASALAPAARAAAIVAAGSIVVPASSAARWGETAGPNVCGATASGARPAAA